MLSAEQQKIIEESLWVVNSVLKDLGLQSDEDLRQEASLYLCKCLERFDQEHGAKWTTYAYKNVYMYIKYRDCSHRTRKQVPTIDFTSVCDGVEDLFPAPPMTSTAEQTLREITKWLAPTDRKIIQMKLNGYTVKEIAEELNYSVSNIWRKFNEIKKQIRENRSCLN